ncbi:MAG: hypothetical protein HZA80_02645 [Candidatus Taylorbacteria bacterium]|nr:hypothetical protein [Candidatus Taylorbacteria bacterium]
MELLGEIFSQTLKLAGAAISAVFENGSKLFQFICWIIAGIVIIPSLFISGTLYPMWEKWGENIKK